MLATNPFFHQLWACEELALTNLYQQWGQQRISAELLKAEASVSRIRTVPGRGDKSVAVIPIVGVMTKGSSWFGTSTLAVQQDLRAAANDPRMSGILLAIDSPGGTVAGTADLGAAVKAARKVKPVWAFGSDQVASAAMWVASQAGAFYANNPTAEVGSIGVLATLVDSSGAAEKSGYKVHVFRTGSLKGTGVPGAPVTEEQQAYLQSRVDQTQQYFAQAVKAGRRLSDARLAKVTTGGVWLAPEAQELGLIDGIQSLDQTIGELIKAG